MEDPNCVDCLTDVVLEMEAFVKCTNTHVQWKVDDGATDDGKTDNGGMVLTTTPLNDPSAEEQEIPKDEETSIPKIRRRKMINPTRRSQRSKILQKMDYYESALRKKERRPTSGIVKME